MYLYYLKVKSSCSNLGDYANYSVFFLNYDYVTMTPFPPVSKCKHLADPLPPPFNCAYIIQWTLVIVNTWLVNNLSLVNSFGETGRLFYNINYMLNSKHLSLVNTIGDWTKLVTKPSLLLCTRVHFTSFSATKYLLNVLWTFT